MWFLANMQYVTNRCKQKWLHHNSRVITRKMELFHLPCHFGAKFCTYIRINILYANLSFYIHLHAHPRPHTCTCTFITPCGLYRAYDKDIEWNDVCFCVCSLFFLYSELKSRLLSAITQQTNGCGCGYGYGSVHAKKIMAKMSMSFK